MADLRAPDEYKAAALLKLGDDGAELKSDDEGAEMKLDDNNKDITTLLPTIAAAATLAPTATPGASIEDDGFPYYWNRNRGLVYNH